MTQATESRTQVYRLHPRQDDIYWDEARHKVITAGRRFGKTHLAIISLVTTALQNDGAKLWYLAPFRQQAKEIAWELLKQLSPKENIARTNESELYIEYVSGSRISIKGADNEESLVGVYLGCKNNPGSLGIVIDEVALIRDRQKVWNTIIRPMLIDCKASTMMIGTPRGKDFFWEMWTKGQRGEDGFKSWQYTSYDNPYIDPAEIDENKRTMTERAFKQEHLASFEDFVGLIYPEFSEYEHVIEPHFVQGVFPKIGAIDPALSGTTAGLKAMVDEDGTVIIYDEYYEKDKRASEVCQEFKEEDVKWYIDPASKAKTVQKEGSLYSLYDEYHENGISAETAENDVLGGINRVGEFLKQNKIKIFKSCTNLIWEIYRYHWTEPKETANGMTEAKPYKKDDHLMDCLKYLIATRQDPADLTVTPIHNPLSAWGKVEEMKQRAKQRR